MICVNKVGKLIGNNYDITGKPEKEDILNSDAGFECRSLRRSNLIHINHSKLLLIK